jgi:hypothetical protein
MALVKPAIAVNVPSHGYPLVRNGVDVTQGLTDADIAE